MKKSVSIFLSVTTIILIIFLSGCSDNKPVTASHLNTQEEFKKVAQVGELPEKLRSAVENNVFYHVTTFDGKVFKVETSSEDKENRTVVYTVKMMDSYGKELVTYSNKKDDAYHIRTLIPTSDGGFLFVLGFEDYAYNQNEWASENGFASRVIKCDSSGKLQFDTPFESIKGEALRCCFEADNKYYLFGSKETPETKTIGVYSPTDVYMTILDSNGDIISTKLIAGSDYDDLDLAEKTEDGFVLYVSSQSNDGDFTLGSPDGYPVDCVVTLDYDLKVIQKERGNAQNVWHDKIGERDGKPVYSNDKMFNDFDAGTPTAFIEYDDFYLVVSNNPTGVYENQPDYISSIWYYTETVYSGYDYNGKLLFRASVDSTPDYDSVVKEAS